MLHQFPKNQTNTLVRTPPAVENGSHTLWKYASNLSADLRKHVSQTIFGWHNLSLDFQRQYFYQFICHPHYLCKRHWPNFLSILDLYHTPQHFILLWVWFICLLCIFKDFCRPGPIWVSKSCKSPENSTFESSDFSIFQFLPSEYLDIS